MSPIGASRRLLSLLAALLVLLALQTAPAAAAPRQAYAGVQERGNLLGHRDAPVRIVLFADLKCPACAPFSRKVMPTIVRRLVRTGRAAVELRLVNIIDPNVGTRDGAVLRTTALNLARRNALWSFSRAAFRDQGREEPEWATPARIAAIGRRAGVIVGKRTMRSSKASRRAARADDALFGELEAQGTPQVFVRRRDDRVHRPTQSRASSIEAAVALLERP